MEAIEHVHGVAGALGGHREVGLPHIGADEAEGGAAGRAEPVEEAVQGHGPAFTADPQQSPAMVVDRVDEGQVVLPAAAGEFVDADGLDVGEVAVGESPVDGGPDGPIDGIPGGGEGVGDLLPGEALGPAGEEPGAGVGEAVLAGGPGDSLDLDAAARAVDAAHSVTEDDGDLPEGHEVEAAWRQGVVAGRGTSALRAPGPGPDARAHADLEGQARGVRVLEQAHGVIDERRVLLNPIQDGLDLHPVPLPRRIDVCSTDCRGFRNGMRQIRPAYGMPGRPDS